MSCFERCISKGFLMRLRTVFLVILASGVIVSCGGGNTTGAEPQEVEAMVDDLFTAFVAADSDSAAAFAEDGVWVDKNGAEWVGTSRVAAYVGSVGLGLGRCERTGPAEATAEGSFVFPVEFTWHGIDYQDVAVLTMADDLIARLDWQSQP